MTGDLGLASPGWEKVGKSARQKLFHLNWKELQIDLWSFGVKNDAKGQNGHAWPVFDIPQNLNGSCFSWTFKIIHYNSL